MCLSTKYYYISVKKDPFYFEIKDVVTQFIAAFNSVVIKRYNTNREPKERIQVRYVYSPKKRVLHDLVNKAQHITIPVIAVNITGVSRDESRVFNKIEGSHYYQNHLALDNTNNTIPLSSSVTRTDFLPAPVPVNISVSMSIITKFQTDMDQILSNFIPYNDPYIVVSWKIPEEFVVVEQEIRSEVLWDGNVSIDYPVDINNTQPYRITGDTSFTIKAWLFKKHAVDYVGTILKIDANIYDGLELTDTLVTDADSTTVVPSTGQNIQLSNILSP